MEFRSENCPATNSSLQADELEALLSIYEEHLILDSENAFTIKICCKSGKEVFLHVTLPGSYPLQSPPVYDISAPWMTRHSKLKLIAEIEDVYRKNMGQNIIHLWIVTIKDFIETKMEKPKGSNGINKPDATVDVADQEAFKLPDIEHGEAISYRKSVFQAHLARITFESQVPLILEKLCENSKIASAKHNTYAYRISCPNGSFIEGCDDDGEKSAGLVLLRNLQHSNLSNVLIVVSRWFGGVLIGPDRFRHYSDAATNLINHLKLIKNDVSSKMKPGLVGN